MVALYPRRVFTSHLVREQRGSPGTTNLHSRFYLGSFWLALSLAGSEV